MIDNVVLIVTGTLHERDVQELLEKCHPLGMFDRYRHFNIVFSFSIPPPPWEKKVFFMTCFFTFYKIFIFVFVFSALLPWQLHRICGSFTDWCLLTHHLLPTFLSALHQRYRLVVLILPIYSNFFPLCFGKFSPLYWVLKLLPSRYQ